MIDFKEIEQDGELWELFARDFLQQIGYYVETTVDRGPDGKKDLTFLIYSYSPNSKK